MRADLYFAFATFTLIAFGMAAIYSVELSQGADFLNIKKQLIALLVGTVIFVAIAFSNYRLLRNYATIFYILGISMMVAVLFFGSTVRGTTGWFSLGVFNFQPVEFMKVALAIALAAYFSKRARKDFRFRELIESGAITALPVLLTFFQPDLGSATLLIGMWLVVLLFAGIKKIHIAILLGFFGSISFLGWKFILAEYQKARLTTFLHPELDPLGQGYNITQAIIAVGAGGLFGRGLGFGSQSQLKFLPESQTDFIFAVIAEELGFLGIALIVSTFLLLFYRIIRLAIKTHDDFTSFLLLAIVGVIFVQFFVNIGMNLGIMPVTGITLPLVSYGGSSLIFTLLMLGIVESIAIRSRYK